MVAIRLMGRPLAFCCLWLLLAASVEMQEQCRDQPFGGPINYTDFSALLLNDRIYVTGGTLANVDVWSLDLRHGLNISCPVWELPSNAAPTPTDMIQPYRNGVAFKTRQDTICVQSGDGGTPQMETIVLYNTTSGTWDIPSEINGQQPLPRSQMSAATNDSTGVTWFYGGRTTEAQEQLGHHDFYHDFYSFDTTTMTWQWPTVRYAWGQRPARYGHTSQLIMSQLFVLGGKTAVVNASDDSWITEPADFQSILVFDTEVNKAVTMATIGDVPAGVSGFSAVVAPDGHSIVVFGGQNTYATGFEATRDVFLLDTCTLMWTKPNVGGNPPLPRVGHQAVTVGNYMLVMMGYTHYDDINGMEYANDIAILDMQSWKWVDAMNSTAGMNVTRPQPNCRFILPRIPENNNNDGSDGDPLNPTVVSGSTSLSTTSKVLVIIFSIVGGLAVGAAIVFVIYRVRKKARTPNPRWLPGSLVRGGTKQSAGDDGYSMDTQSAKSNECER